MAQRGNLKDFSKDEQYDGKVMSIASFRKAVQDTGLSPKEVWESAKAQGISIEGEQQLEDMRGKIKYNQEKATLRELEAERAKISGIQKWTIRNIANPIRKRLGKSEIDPNLTLVEQGGESFKEIAFDDLGFAPDVIAGASQAVASVPTDVVGTVVGLFNKEKGAKISSAGDITPFLEKNGLADTRFFDISKMATDLGISAAATTSILKGISSISALKNFGATYPGWSKWLIRPIAEGGLGTQLASVTTEGEAATARETAFGVGASLVFNTLFNGYAALKGDKITPEKAAAQITGQSGKVSADDIPKIADAIQDQALNTDDVVTYSQLSEKTKQAKQTLYQAQKQYLQQFKQTFGVDDLNIVIKEGTDEATDNFVVRALNELDELAKSQNSISNPKILGNKVSAWTDKINKGLLTLDDINDIAIDYAKNVKGFSDATGRPLTSVTANQARSTRQGIKNTLRGLLPDDISASLDKRYHNLSTLSDVADDMKEKVFKLWRKTNKQSMGDKLADVVDKADEATGGVLGALRRKFGIPSGRGKKVLDALGLEERLAKNIQIVQSIDDGLSSAKDANAVAKLFNEIKEEFALSSEELADRIAIMMSAETADFLGDSD